MTTLDLRPSFTVALDAFGQSATVTPPGGSPVPTRVVWLPPVTTELPAGGALQRAEPLRVIGVAKADVPQVPRGTLIAAAELPGGPVQTWKVDGFERVDPDHHRVVVVPA